VPGTLFIYFVIFLTIHIHYSSSGCSPAGYSFFLSWVSYSCIWANNFLPAVPRVGCRAGFEPGAAVQQPSTLNTKPCCTLKCSTPPRKEGRIRNRTNIETDLDPGGQKSNGSYGSGSGTLRSLDMIILRSYTDLLPSVELEFPSSSSSSTSSSMFALPSSCSSAFSSSPSRRILRRRFRFRRARSGRGSEGSRFS
jgi:hypothetical protein